MPDDHVIVNLDFSNAINSLYRNAMLKAVADRVPSNYKFCHLPYSQPTILKFNNHRIMSEDGPQQRDLLGDLLFCHTIHPLLSQMKADLVDGYMTTLPSVERGTTYPVTSYRSDPRAWHLGLQLNAKK